MLNAKIFIISTYQQLCNRKIEDYIIIEWWYILLRCSIVLLSIAAIFPIIIRIRVEERHPGQNFTSPDNLENFLTFEELSCRFVDDGLISQGTRSDCDYVSRISVAYYSS